MTHVTFHRGAATGPEATLVTLSADACRSQPYTSRTTESAGRVLIELRAFVPTEGVVASCSDLVDVRLEHQLGTRTLVDASTGRRVPVVMRLLGS